MINNVHDSITSFIRMRPSLLHNTDGTDHAFPTPRTWAMLNRKLLHMTDVSSTVVLRSSVMARW